MMRSMKKFLQLFSFFIGLSSSLVLPMSSRVVSASSSASRSALSQSLTRSFLPNPYLRVLGSAAPRVSMPQISAPSTQKSAFERLFPRAFARAQRGQVSAPVQAKPIIQPKPRTIKVEAPAKPAQVVAKPSQVEVPQIMAPQQVVSTESKPSFEQRRAIQQMWQPYNAAQILNQDKRVPQASQDSNKQGQEEAQSQVQTPQVSKAQAPEAKKRTESVRDTMQRIMQKNRKPAEKSVTIAREPSTPLIVKPSMGVVEQAVAQPQAMDLINLEPIGVSPIVEGKRGAEIIQPEAMHGAKARVGYNKAMSVLNPVLNVLDRLQHVQPNVPEYVTLHNDLRNALLQANNQGYSIGFAEKQLVDRVSALPDSSIKLLQNQPDVGSVIMPAQALGLMSGAQAPFVLNILGLQGEFVPFIYSRKNTPCLGNGLDAMFEIVRASMNKNNPLQVDRSQIIISPLVPQLMPPAQDAQGQLIIEPQVADGAAMGNGGNGNNNGNVPLSNAENRSFNSQPDVSRVGSQGGYQGEPQSSMGSIARSLGGASSNADESLEPIAEPVLEPELNYPGEQEMELPQASPREVVSGQQRKVSREVRLSIEEQVISLYWSKILTALRLRMHLELDWAGESQALKTMFVDYNNLLDRYNKLKNPFTNELYTDANSRIYKVVIDILANLGITQN